MWKIVWIWLGYCLNLVILVVLCLYSLIKSSKLCTQTDTQWTRVKFLLHHSYCNTKTSKKAADIAERLTYQLLRDYI